MNISGKALIPLLVSGWFLVTSSSSRLYSLLKVFAYIKKAKNPNMIFRFLDKVLFVMLDNCKVYKIVLMAILIKTNLKIRSISAIDA